jgi:arabinogalactan oligomer/maltooligosaccharide transport system substrate-binding protein
MKLQTPNFTQIFRLILILILGISAVGVPTAAAKAWHSSAPITGTLTLWHSYEPGSSNETALNQVIQNAQNDNPGLAVVTEFHAFETSLTDYQAAVQAGGGPDLLDGSSDWIGDLSRAGHILNLDSYLTGNLTNVTQPAIDGMKVDGQMYGVPKNAFVVAMYYNKSSLPTPPTTTAELLDVLQNDGKSIAGPGNAGSYFYYGFWSAFGGQLLDGTGRCIADQGGFQPAMQYLLDLQTAGAVLDMDYAIAESQFLNGDVDMLINGNWALPNYESALGTDLGVAALPTGPSGAAHPMTDPNGYFVNPNTADPGNAVNLALYMTNQASSQTMTDVGGHIPVRSDVTSANPLINTFAQASIQGETRPQVWQFNNYWEPFNIMITNVLAGTTTPTVGVQQACFQMNELNGFTVTRSYNSAAAQDGWILESAENSSKGGTLNTAAATTISLGDNAQKKQYRSILSFNTSSLPDNAVITKITLKVKKQAILGGGNPVTAFQGFMLDVRKGFFGATSGLAIGDFQVTYPSGYKTYGPLTPTLTGGWYTFNLTTAKAYINKLNSASGLTQIRLRFKLDDNNNTIANILNLYSGNAPLASRPQLTIEYHLP